MTEPATLAEWEEIESNYLIDILQRYCEKSRIRAMREVPKMAVSASDNEFIFGDVGVPRRYHDRTPRAFSIERPASGKPILWAYVRRGNPNTMEGLLQIPTDKVRATDDGNLERAKLRWESYEGDTQEVVVFSAKIFQEQFDDMIFGVESTRGTVVKAVNNANPIPSERPKAQTADPIGSVIGGGTIGLVLGLIIGAIIGSVTICGLFGLLIGGWAGYSKW